MPILTTAGVLQGGIISDAAKQSFVDDVIKILKFGNANSLVNALPQSLIFNGSNFLSVSFDANSLNEHVTRFPIWHKIFIDFMFQTTANILDIDGSMPLIPIVDYTLIFSGLGFPQRQLTLPEFAVGMGIVDPTFQAQLQFFFDVSLDDITPELLVELIAAIPLPSLPLPPLPNPGILPINIVSPFIIAQFPTFELPNFIIPSLPPFQFPDVLPLPIIGFILCAVIEAVPKIFGILIAKSLAGELLEALSNGPTGLIIFVATVVIDAIASCLGVELKNFITFLAGFIIYIERLTAMFIVVLIGCIFGEGQLVITAANALGLT